MKTNSLLFRYNYYIFKTSLDTVAEANRIESEVSKVKNWLIYSIVATVGMTLLLLILLIMRTRIALVAQLFREAGKALVSMPFLLLQPLWTLLVLVGLVGALCYGFLYIETSGEPTIDSNSGFVSFKQGNVLFYMKWYYIFGILWVIQLVFACHQLVIAGAVSTWYFSR